MDMDMDMDGIGLDWIGLDRIKQPPIYIN